MDEPREHGDDAGALAGGTRVGAFRVDRYVANGGAGTVYLAHNEESGRRVAIKVMRASAGDEGPTARARFEREARAAGAVGHEALVAIESTGHLDDGRPYLVMPFLEGRSLREEVTARGALPPDEAWRIVREAALAVHAAHEAGVVHRDLKPDNLFLEAEKGAPPRVRVLDFGLAKIDVTSHKGESEADLVRALTRSAVTVGTPAYMAPEQWWNSGVSAATDQYALGIVLYELIAGRPPFSATSIAEVVQEHLHGAVPSLASAPDGTDAFLARALAKSASDRFESTRAFVDAGDALFGVPRAAPDPAQSPSVRRDLHLAVVGATLAMAFAVGYAGDARHDLRAWLVLGGVPQFVTLAALLVGIVLLPRAVRLALEGRFVSFAVALAMAPAVIGELGTFVDWVAVEAVLPKFADPLAAAHEGMFETELARFVGCISSFALLASLSTMLRAAPARTPRGEALRVLVGALTFVQLPILAFTRIDAREAYAWGAGGTRAARAAEIIAVARERTITSLVFVMLFALAAWWLVGRARALRGKWRPSRRALPGLVVLGLLALGDLAFRARATRVLDDLRRAMEPELTLYAHLDPPDGGRLDATSSRPRSAPTVQIARGAVAVNAKGVAPLAALRSTEGSLVVGAELNRALAAAVAAHAEPPSLVRSNDETPELALVVDRDVSYADMHRVLEMAWGSGVRRVDLLLTRGPAPVLGENAPPEAAHVIAGDFVALPITLDPRGLAPSESTRWGDVVPTLIDARVGGAVPQLAVGP